MLLAKGTTKTIIAQTAKALMSGLAIAYLLHCGQAKAAKTTLLCREIEGVEKSSTLSINLEAKTIRWIWNDMYRDYKITKLSESKIYASSNDPAFLYEMQFDRQSLIRSERR